MAANDELVSQFLMFTGSEDTAKAISYLEMCAGDLERAVSLFMDHTQGGATAARPDDQIRAPDATQTMRLMDDVGPMGQLPFMPFDSMHDTGSKHSRHMIIFGLILLRDGIPSIPLPDVLFLFHSA